jgi:hypothetical protein
MQAEACPAPDQPAGGAATGNRSARRAKPDPSSRRELGGDRIPVHHGDAATWSARGSGVTKGIGVLPSCRAAPARDSGGLVGAGLYHEPRGLRRVSPPTAPGTDIAALVTSPGTPGLRSSCRSPWPSPLGAASPPFLKSATVAVLACPPPYLRIAVFRPAACRLAQRVVRLHRRRSAARRLQVISRRRRDACRGGSAWSGRQVRLRRIDTAAAARPNRPVGAAGAAVQRLPAASQAHIACRFARRAARSDHQRPG